MSFTHRGTCRKAAIIPDKLFLAFLDSATAAIPADIPVNSLCYYLDDDIIYEPFCADFGPCNLAHTYRFCLRMNSLLKQAEERQCQAYILVGPHPHKRANAATLVGIYSVLYLENTPDDAYAPLSNLEPYAGFRDASCGAPLYELEVLSVIRGAARARDIGFIRWPQGEILDVAEYEHYEQVENGDLNWIVPGKFMAFSGPSAQPKHYVGWRTFTPEDYIEYFEENNVTAVVRLNKKMYDSQQFTAHGVKHYDLYFPDGTCPPLSIQQKFLEIAENEPGALAVHCKAGLGRTGVLICCYMIKHYGFSAEEAMGYIRMCRPGSVLGPQQNYLVQHAPRLLYEGRILRSNRRKSERAAAAAALAASTAVPMDVESADSTGIASKQGSASAAIINITASSVGDELDLSQATITHSTNVRRSPRLAASLADSPTKSVASTTNYQQYYTGYGSGRLADSEPDHIVSVGSMPPPASTKPMISNAGSFNSSQRPTTPSQGGKQPLAMMCSRSQSLQSVDNNTSSAGNTPTQASKLGQGPPPSSTKRVTAPNGQPRKIPMAMDFDMVANGHELEDRDATEDEWTLSSKPHMGGQQSGGKKVGALAAAAGRGASAFVDAFRGVMGVYRTNSGTPGRV